MSKTANGIVYSDDMKKVEGVESKDITGAVIAEGVTEIGECAFQSCKLLTLVTIPESVTKIGDAAFQGCESLISVTIPECVTEIGDVAFDKCAIKELIHPCLTITDGLAVQDNVVLYCSNVKMTEISIPKNVTTIGSRAFVCCKSLRSVKVPESVTEIGDTAFLNCIALKTFEIPEGIMEIGKCAFWGCTALSEITFDGTMEQWSILEKGVRWNENLPAKRVKSLDGDVAL